MKTQSFDPERSQATKVEAEAGSCTEPGHCPPESPAKADQVMLPRLQRRIPPEAERRAFEDAVNGWWWL